MMLYPTARNSGEPLPPRARKEMGGREESCGVLQRKYRASVEGHREPMVALQGGRLREASWAQGRVGKGGPGGSNTKSRPKGFRTECGGRGVKGDPGLWHVYWWQRAV